MPAPSVFFLFGFFFFFFLFFFLCFFFFFFFFFFFGFFFFARRWPRHSVTRTNGDNSMASFPNEVVARLLKCPRQHPCWDTSLAARVGPGVPQSLLLQILALSIRNDVLPVTFTANVCPSLVRLWAGGVSCRKEYARGHDQESILRSRARPARASLERLSDWWISPANPTAHRSSKLRCPPHQFHSIFIGTFGRCRFAPRPSVNANYVGAFLDQASPLLCMPDPPQ